MHTETALVKGLVMGVVLLGISLVQHHNRGRSPTQGLVEYPGLALGLLFGSGLVLLLLGVAWLGGHTPLVLPASVIVLGILCCLAGGLIARTRLLYNEDRVLVCNGGKTLRFEPGELLVRETSTRSGPAWTLRDKKGRVVFTVTLTMLGAKDFVAWALEARVKRLKATGALREGRKVQAPRKRRLAARR